MVTIKQGHAPAVQESHVDVAQATAFTTVISAARLAVTSIVVELCWGGWGGCKLSMPTSAGVRAAGRRGGVSVGIISIAGAAGSGMSAEVGTHLQALVLVLMWGAWGHGFQVWLLVLSWSSLL